MVGQGGSSLPFWGSCLDSSAWLGYPGRGSIVDIWVSVGRISTECDAYDRSPDLRINDQSLALDCVSGPLTRGNMLSCTLVLGICH